MCFCVWYAMPWKSFAAGHLSVVFPDTVKKEIPNKSVLFVSINTRERGEGNGYVSHRKTK